MQDYVLIAAANRAPLEDELGCLGVAYRQDRRLVGIDAQSSVVHALLKQSQTH